MDLLDVVKQCGGVPKRAAANEYSSPCPMCGGNDRFRVWPDDNRWWCRGCDKKGDDVQLLIEAKKMTFKEACQVLGRPLKNPGTRRSRTLKPPEAKREAFEPRPGMPPAELWRGKAEAFAAGAHEALLKNAEQLAWLAQRGISEASVRRFRLGWNAAAIWRDKKVWGVEDNGKKLWLPLGLVIPTTGPDGSIKRLRIRQPEGEPRYVQVSGSESTPMTIARTEPPAFDGKGCVVVESELDAILLAQEAGDIVTAAAMGSAAIKPDSVLYAELKAADYILVALDADKAGTSAKAWWQEHFPQAIRWPVPSGKDPGDYKKAGGDIRAWILAGVPPFFKLLRQAEPQPPAPETSAPPVEDPWFIVDSKVFAERVIVLKRDSVRFAAREAYPGLVAYTPAEIAALKEIEGKDDVMRKIHLVKKALNGSVIAVKDAPKPANSRISK